eukprot:5416_1
MLLSGVAILTFIQIVSSYNNGVGQRPVMGWNTWCSIEGCGTDICNQWEVVQIAQAMKSNGMYDAGYNRVNLDDCWDDSKRSSNNSLQPNPDRFPDGIKALADNLHKLDIKFGLYTSAGDKTCRGQPGSFGHYTQDANTFAAWGVDYVKIDWCGNNCTNPQQQHTQFSNALNATGRPIWLELCRGYSHPPPPYVAQVANSWRMTGDHHDNWASTYKEISSFPAGLSTNISGEYNWGYGDFLMTGGEGCSGDSNPNITHKHCPGQSDIEYMTEFSMYAIVQSPLIVATDVRNMTDIMKKVLLNKDIIAINQNIKYGPGNIVSSETTNCDKNVSNACQVWSKQLETNSAAVVLFNAGDAKHDISFDFSSIPGMSWTQTTKLDLKDLWQKKDVGSFTGKYTGSNIDVHGVQFLLATQS